MSKINVYVRKTKLNNVVGRVRYISSQEEQEEKLIAVAGNLDNNFWNQLAAECKQATKNGKDGAHIEGVELVIYLPNDLLKESPERQLQVLQSLQELIQELTGTECAIGLHDSHAADPNKPGNCHAHVVMSERALLPEGQRKVADRNLFYDETGKRVYKKADIMENGQLRPGCSIIKKGTVLNAFDSKNEEMSTDWWLENAKKEIATWINQELQPDLQRVVYDRENDPYLTQIHIVKGTPSEVAEPLERANKAVRTYNSYIQQGVISYDEAMYYKPLLQLSPDKPAEIVNVLQHFIQEKEDPTYQFTDNTAAAARTRNNNEPAEKLRAAYREANIAWKEYREYDGPSKEYKSELLRKARAASAEVDRQKCAMGLWQLKDYEKALDKALQQERYWWKQYVYANNKLVGYSNRDYYLLRREDYIKHLIDEENKKFFPDKAYIAGLKRDIEQLEQERMANEREWNEAYSELRRKKREAKKEYKAARKEVKVQKRELRAKQISDFKEKVTTQVKGLNSMIDNAAGRSGAPAGAKTRNKERDER